ncbi:uncharacterized protein LOC144448321 [Glandiceps talaboti]
MPGEGGGTSTSVKYHRGVTSTVPGLDDDRGWDWKTIVVIILGFIDVLTDWLNYSAWANLSAGLLVGPPHTMTLFGLLVFSIAGTFTFIFDSVNSFFKATGRKHITQDYAGLVPMWLEDIPLAFLNVLIAPCSWATAKVTQLLTVAVATTVCLFKFFKLLFNFCFKGTCCENPMSSVIVLAFSFVGTGLVVSCSVAVFIRNLQQLKSTHTYGLQNAYIAMPSHYQNHILISLEDVANYDVDPITHIEYLCNKTLDKGVLGQQCPPEFSDPAMKSIIFGFEYIRPTDKVPFGNIQYDTKLMYSNGDCVTHGMLDEPSYLWYCVKDETGVCSQTWERDLCEISSGPEWHEEVSLSCDLGKKVIEQR